MYLTHPNGAADGGHGPPAVRPGAHISVRWEIPAEVVEGYGRPMRQTTAEEHRQQLMVGLFRLGVASNTAGIISKSMFDSDRPPSRPGNPKRTLSGHTPFYAPKSVSVGNEARNEKQTICMYVLGFSDQGFYGGILL